MKELWISYNEIEKLDGLKSLIKLEKLYIGNNLISKIEELNNISNLPELKDVVFKGNPFTLENPSLWNSKPQDRNPTELYPEILKRLPNVQIIDGNNLISKIEELNNLANLPELKDVVFKGNPFTLENPSLWNSKPQDRNPSELYPEIQKRLPNVQIIDGNTV